MKVMRQLSSLNVRDIGCQEAGRCHNNSDARTIRFMRKSNCDSRCISVKHKLRISFVYKIK